MKFLIDQALSYVVAQILQRAGYDAVHVRDYHMSTAPDSAIFERASDEDRIVITLDSDFGTLLALRSEVKPSVILLRQVSHIPQQQAALILANLPTLETYLLQGCIVIFHRSRLRIRMLPIDKPTL